MNRELINITAFFVGVLISFFLLVGTSHAVVAPTAYTIFSQPIAPSTAQALCDHYIAVEGRAAGYYVVSPDTAVTAGSNSFTVSGVTYNQVWGSSASSQKCLAPSTQGVRAPQIRPVQYCVGPISGTYPAATCSACPSGTVEINGACVVPNECTETAGQVVSSGMFDLGPDANASPPSTTCDGQCELSYTGSDVVARQLIGGVYHYFSEGSYTRTATQCTTSTALDGSPSLPPPSCDPATQDQGTVNGKFVCLNRTTTETETPPVTNPDGSTTQTTTTNNADGSTTTTTTTTATDGTKTTSSTTEGSPDGDPFCTANPTHDSCRKDDIPWGDVPEPGLIPTHEIPVTTAYDVIGGEGYCPGNQTVSFLGQSITWEYTPLCTFAEMIRPLVIGMSWLSFGFIIVGGLGRGGS